MKIILTTILIIIWAIIANSCASIQAPNGGPRDTIAPNIIYFEPMPKTLNFNNSKMVFEFSKYMDKGKLADNIIFQPATRLEYSWWGKELDIKFLDTLKPNTTYSLTFTSEFPDVKGNKMKNSKTIFFSTGNNIDSGQIAGKLLTESPQGVYIFCYRINNINPDTLNPSHTKPDYKTQVGSDKSFTFQALKDGTYRLFAIDDKFKDEVYNEGIDRFATAPSDIMIKQAVLQKTSIKYGKIVDKEAPYCNNITILDARTLLLNFNEELDTNSVRAENFILTDSITNAKIPTAFAYLGNKQRSDIFVELKDTMRIKTKYTLQIGAVKDTSGNQIADSNRKFPLESGDEQKDKAIVTKFTSPFKDSTVNIEPISSFEFSFEAGAMVNSLKDISFTDEKNKTIVDFDIVKSYSNKVIIKPKAKLEFLTPYIIKLNPKNFNPKLKDTNVVLHFTTAIKKDLSNIKGKIKDSTGYRGAYILKIIGSNSKQVIQIYLPQAGEWEYKGISEGSYTFEVIQDKNSNKIFDYGDIFPFKYSEVSYPFEKETNIKAGWDTDEIVLVVK